MRAPPRRKRYGQHFLTDPRILARIATALEATRGDTVVEIGPGRGALTHELLRHAGRVVAIEVDHSLAAQLAERYRDDVRITIIDADILAVDLARAAGGPFLLIGNIPYNITTPILFKALASPRPGRAVFLVQREVAERVSAPPGSRVYGALSVNVQAFARVDMLFRVVPGAFSPPPAVESAVIRLVPRDQSLVAPHEEEAFRTLVLAAFGMRRKQIHRVIRSLWRLAPDAASSVLERAGIDVHVRPETLSAADFARLLRSR